MAHFIIVGETHDQLPSHEGDLRGMLVTGFLQGLAWETRPDIIQFNADHLKEGTT